MDISTTTLEAATTAAQTTTAEPSYVAQATQNNKTVTGLFNTKAKPTCKRERKIYKEAHCTTQNIRAHFYPSAENSHTKARFTISTGDKIASIDFNGHAAKSLYLMLKQVFE